MDNEKFRKISDVIDLFLDGKSYAESDIPAIDRYLICKLLALRSKYYIDKSWVPFWEQSAKGYLDNHLNSETGVQG